MGPDRDDRADARPVTEVGCTRQGCIPLTKAGRLSGLRILATRGRAGNTPVRNRANWMF